MIDHLQSDNCRDNEHGDIEQYIQNEGFEVLRCLFQGYLDLKTASEKTIKAPAEGVVVLGAMISISSPP